jgi:signal peptidase I
MESEKIKEHGYDYHTTKLGKIWHFIAHEESLASFIVDAIIVILVGKFVILPIIGFALGTQFPLVAVVSSSMEHHGNFDEWWRANGNWYISQNITKEEFLQFPHYNGFNKGDVFIVKGIKLDDVKVGDVIVYMVPEKKDPIIHRVVAKKENTLSTKGDANLAQFDFELTVTESQLKGVAKYRVPYLGWVKVIFTEFTNAILKIKR